MRYIYTVQTLAIYSLSSYINAEPILKTERSSSNAWISYLLPASLCKICQSFFRSYKIALVILCGLLHYQEMKILTTRALLLVLLLSPLTGCRVFKADESKPDNTLTRFFPGGKKVQPEPGELQQSLLQFAEGYCLGIIESIDEVQGGEGSPFTPEAALRYKISSVGTLLTTSTGENPNLNLLNLLALSSLSRMVLENHWVTTPNGALFEPWLTRSKALELKIWDIADKVLTKEQQEELRQSIEQHYASLTDLDSLFMMHPQDLMTPEKLKQNGDEHSVFSLATINPLSGLDPTVREITQMRLFAERALFTIQWMPWLLRWQSDLLILETTSKPEIAQTLADVTSLSESIDRASKAAESISKTAAVLPDQLSSEREAIIAAMNDQEGQLTTLFEAGGDMSTSLTSTIDSLDALMKRFGVGEPRDPNKPPRDPNRKRFDILDYAKTADSFTATAEQLNTTLAELNATLDSPALDKLSEKATADVRSVLNHLFLLAGGLVLLIFTCSLVYRKVAKPKV